MKNKILFFLFLSLFIGCEKDEPVPEVKYIPQELKDYMYFKTGTWWVYEEETTHERDSVIVFYDDDSLITFDGSSGTPVGTYEYFDCNTHSSYDDYGYYYSCNTTWTTNDGRTPVFRDKAKPGDAVGETIIMFNHFIIGNKLYPYAQTGSVTLTGIYDSLSIQGKYFSKVIRFYDSKNSTVDNYPTNFFVSKQIGIVRKEIFSINKIWNLVNYNIIK